MCRPTESANPVPGEQIEVDESASTTQRMVWDELRPARIDPAPVHYHPETEGRFEVRTGVLVGEIDGEVHHIGADEEVIIRPATPHVSSTEAESTRFKRDLTPPGQWRDVLTGRLAAVHAVGELSGRTGLLQTVFLVRSYQYVVVPAQPPRVVQRVIFPVLAVVARIMGLKSIHQYPRDDESASKERPPNTTS